MNPRTILLLLLLISTSCIRRVTVTATHQPVYKGLGWIAIEERSGALDVFITDKKFESAAFKELCQTHRYVCTVPERAGYVIAFTRVRK